MSIDITDLFAPYEQAKPEPPNLPHVLVVEGEDMWVEHLPSCPQEDWLDCVVYDCGVGFEEINMGLSSFFAILEEDMDYNSSLEVLIDGRYWVEHWVHKYTHWEYGPEWDSGLRLIYPEEAQLVSP